MNADIRSIEIIGTGLNPFDDAPEPWTMTLVFDDAMRPQWRFLI